MDARQIFEKLREEFKEDIIDIVEDKNSDTFIKIKPERIAEVCFYLRDEKDLNFDYMVNLTGMDYGKLLTVVYHLYSINLKHRIVLKVELDKESPNVPSVEMVWKTANWHEREAFDMFGIIFEDHPFLVRILNPYDWEGYPLRKDYKTPEYYHGIRVPY